MIRLYHGSNQPIEKVNLARGKKFKDFGQGFYTTHIQEQAALWAKRITDRYGGVATVTEFDFDLDAALSDGLNVKIFEEPNAEWAKFVMANRSGAESGHQYDIVIGPVADDNMARLFGLYEMNIINLEAVVSGLIYKNLNSQYFFATPRALKYLKKL